MHSALEPDCLMFAHGSQGGGAPALVGRTCRFAQISCNRALRGLRLGTSAPDFPVPLSGGVKGWVSALELLQRLILELESADSDTSWSVSPVILRSENCLPVVPLRYPFKISRIADRNV